MFLANAEALSAIGGRAVEAVACAFGGFDEGSRLDRDEAGANFGGRTDFFGVASGVADGRVAAGFRGGRSVLVLEHSPKVTNTATVCAICGHGYERNCEGQWALQSGVYPSCGCRWGFWKGTWNACRNCDWDQSSC